jgi:hypothetical protein
VAVTAPIVFGAAFKPKENVMIANKGAVRLKQEASDYPSSAVLQAAQICRHSFKATVRFDLKLFRL